MNIVERLRGTSTADVSAWMALTNEAADEIERLRSQVERMTAALKPFAAFLEDGSLDRAKDNWSYPVDIGHLRRARAALATKSPKK